MRQELGGCDTTVNEDLVSVISKQYSRDKLITVLVGQPVVVGF